MTPDLETLEAAQRDRGIVCRGCHKLRLWGQLDIAYSLHGPTDSKDVYRRWICMVCYNVVREDNITDYQIQSEIEKRNEQ